VAQGADAGDEQTEPDADACVVVHARRMPKQPRGKHDHDDGQGEGDSAHQPEHRTGHMGHTHTHAAQDASFGLSGGGNFFVAQARELREAPEPERDELARAATTTGCSMPCAQGAGVVSQAL